LPRDVFSCIDAVCSKDPIGEDKRRRAHSWNADALSLQIFNCVNVRLHARLYPKTSPVDSGEKPHIQSLFDRLKEVHHEMMSDIVAAQRERIFVICPIALHQLRLEAFLLEEALLVCSVDRRFASEPNVADTNFI